MDAELYVTIMTSFGCSEKLARSLWDLYGYCFKGTTDSQYQAWLNVLWGMTDAQWKEVEAWHVQTVAETATNNTPTASQSDSGPKTQ